MAGHSIRSSVQQKFSSQIDEMSDIRSLSKQFLIEFIDLYKSLPALWKVKSKEYSDRNKKNETCALMIEKLKEVNI